MVALPIVARELRVQSRRKSTHWIRVAASLIGGVMMVWLFFVGASPVPTVSQGQALFSGLSILSLVYCLLIGPIATADCLSVEKREGTLGLIFLTDLKGYDVIFGKLASSSLHAIYGLVAVLPMMSMAFLFGGVTPAEIGRTALVLGNTLFFSLAAGMFISTISLNDRKAAFGAIFLILCVAGGPYELGYYLANNYARGTALDVVDSMLWPSPIFAFVRAQDATPVGVSRLPELYASVAQTHVLAWGLLALSSYLVPRVWKDALRGRRIDRWRNWWRDLTFGGPEARARHRARMLQINPCCWLGIRGRLQHLIVWMLILPLGAIGLWTYLGYPLMFYEVALILLLVQHVLVKVWLTGEVCRRWIEDRQTGALELLLCTPLQTRDFFAGQFLALRRQFAWPGVALLVLTGLAWAGVVHHFGRGSSTTTGRAWLLMSLPVFVADVITLSWVSMWQGLTARSLNRALAGSLIQVLMVRWYAYLLLAGVGQFVSWMQMGGPSFLGHPLVWLIMALSFDLVFGIRARRNFSEAYRIIASSPADFRPPTARKKKATGAPNERSTRSRTRRRVTAAAVAVLLLALIASGPALYRAWLRAQIADGLSALKKAGILVRIADVNRKRPPLQGAHNAATTVNEIAPYVLSLFRLPWEVQRSLPGWRTPLPTRTARLPATNIHALEQTLSSNQFSLEIIRAAPSLQNALYATDWQSGGMRFATENQALHNLQHLLRLETLLDIEKGNGDLAIVSLRRQIELARSLENEAWPFFPRVQGDIVAGALAGLERLLARRESTAEQLIQLQRALFEADLHGTTTYALEGWCALVISARENPLIMGQPAFLRGPRTSEEFRANLRKRWAELTGSEARDYLALLRVMKDLAELGAIPWPNQYPRAMELSARLKVFDANRHPRWPLNPTSLFNTIILPGYLTHARCRIAFTALAVERFRLEYKSLPDSLERLVPEFLSSVPLDPFANRPISYQKRPTGFCVYSAGPDGKDHGGSEIEPYQPQNAIKLPEDITFVVER